jgi:hypothetical protein
MMEMRDRRSEIARGVLISDLSSLTSVEFVF